MDQPTSPETLAALRKLRDAAQGRGDEAMAVLLSGIELYARLGREYELIEVMKQFADEIRPAVENTPTAEELQALFDRESEDPASER